MSCRRRSSRGRESCGRFYRFWRFSPRAIPASTAGPTDIITMDATATLWVDDSPAPAASESAVGVSAQRVGGEDLAVGQAAGATERGPQSRLHDRPYARHVRSAAYRRRSPSGTCPPSWRACWWSRSRPMPICSAWARSRSSTRICGRKPWPRSACVDYVAVARGASAVDAIETVMPDIYAFWDEGKSGDGSKARQRDEAAVDAVGGQFVQSPPSRCHGPAESSPLAAGVARGGRVPRFAPCPIHAKRRGRGARQNPRDVGPLYRRDDHRRVPVLRIAGQVGQGARARSPLRFRREVRRRRAGHGQPVGRLLRSGGPASPCWEKTSRTRISSARSSIPRSTRRFSYMAAARTIVKRRMVETYPFPETVRGLLHGPRNSRSGQSGTVCQAARRCCRATRRWS